MEDKSTNVLVLGGGIGGVVATNVLSRKSGREHEIMLADRRTEHRFPPHTMAHDGMEETPLGY